MRHLEVVGRGGFRRRMDEKFVFWRRMVFLWNRSMSTGESFVL
jgi:hypothetical protein